MRFVRLLPIAFLLTSCEPAPFYLDVTQASGGLAVAVYEKWWFGLRSSETPCVHDMTLTRKPDEQVVWRTVVDTDRQCSDLATFVIGRSPSGFRDDVPLTTPLPPGDYSVAASGIGYGWQDFTLPLSR